MKAPFQTIGAWRRHKDIFTNHNIELISDKGVSRTAPATPLHRYTVKKIFFTTLPCIALHFTYILLNIIVL